MVARNAKPSISTILRENRGLWTVYISVACNFFRMSAINVQISQAHNSTEITRERISLIFELREIWLSFQMVFILAGAAVVCAILDSTSGLDPWSVTTAPRYLKLLTSSNVVSHQFGFLCTIFHAKGPGDPPGRLVPPLILPGHQCHQQNVRW